MVMMMVENDSSIEVKNVRTADPILILRAGRGDEATLSSSNKNNSSVATPRGRSAITSLCFLSSPREEANNPDSDDDDDDAEFFPLSLKSHGLLLQQQQNHSNIHNTALAASSYLSGMLASCHANGDTLIWDLNQRKSVGIFAPNRGPAMLLRRTSHGQEDTSMLSTAHVVFQTRDANGRVSLHDVTQMNNIESNNGIPMTASFDTYSSTFCTAAPCTGNPHLIALPTGQDQSACLVRDWRIAAAEAPVATIRNSNHKNMKLGMLTSLSMAESSNATLVACGMESGHVLFYDLRMISNDHSTALHVQMGKDPVLCMDMQASSRPLASSVSASFVTIAGTAASGDDPTRTIAVIKTSQQQHEEELPLWSCRVRNRLHTSKNQPGVATCRIVQDKVLAVGGWDHRIRLFDRKHDNRLLAILRGHEATVEAMDWATTASPGILLASGAADGSVLIWKCF